VKEDTYEGQEDTYRGGQEYTYERAGGDTYERAGGHLREGRGTLTRRLEEAYERNLMRSSKVNHDM
jgi:hypothetical protein